MNTGHTTGAEIAPKQPEETVIQRVPQATQQKQTQRETVIVTTPNTDASKWKKYARTYYGRIGTSSDETTNNRRQAEYLQWKTLLETAGYQVIELPGRLEIIDPA